MSDPTGETKLEALISVLLAYASLQWPGRTRTYDCCKNIDDRKHAEKAQYLPRAVVLSFTTVIASKAPGCGSDQIDSQQKRIMALG